MASSRLRSLVALILGLIPLTLPLHGCGKPAAPRVTPAPVVKSVGKPLTEKECLAVGAEMSRAIQAGDLAAFNNLVDWDLINETSTANVDVDEKFRRDFIGGVNKSRAEGKGFADELVNAMKQGGSYTMLHYHIKDNRPYLLFRLLMANAGATYHDLPLARRPGGKVQATDVYMFTAGELLSETYRRLFVQAASQATGLVNKLTGTEQKFAKYIKDLGAMNQLRRDGKFREALDVYKQLPADLRNDRSVLLIRLQIAQGLDDNAEYTQSIADFRAQYPNDAGLDLLSIDYHLLRKEYSESLACIDRLDKAVLGDPYLQTMRANVHAEAGDLTAARADLQKAIEADPTLVDAYWGLIGVALRQKDFSTTLQTLRQIRDRFGLTIADLTAVPLYKEFTESPQYEEWLKDKSPEPAQEKEEPAKPQG